jgi:hypothetical protein
MLEGKVEKLELKAQIHELKEEIYGQKLKEVEQSAKIANNQVIYWIKLIICIN